VKYVNRLQNWVFRQVHENNLIYNTCWEDPRCDRDLLEFAEDSEIVMITSAGCNALDYLLDSPTAIHCVDMNPRQNALLELKKASLKQLGFEDHFRLFGKGKHTDFPRLYGEELKAVLPTYAQAIWERNIHHFSGTKGRKSFYHYGTSGTVAWLIRAYFKARPKIHQELKALFASTTIEEQRRRYDALEPRIINQLVHWMVNRHFTMCLIGVPSSQQELFKHEYEKGITGFLKECLRKVFRNLPIQENYFWQLYFNGHYTKECAPNYLNEAYFEQLKQTVDRVQTHTTTLTQFLQDNPGSYSHYILLDHQDWLAANDVDALEEEWRTILANSRSGTRILLRSAAKEADFIPAFVLDQVAFADQESLVESHAADRVGTYASVHVGIVK
jgi:S-adenosylmethionine-diacylglycerol 3-amino-3-carboxypropyl transferase